MYTYFIIFIIFIDNDSSNSRSSDANRDVIRERISI